MNALRHAQTGVLTMSLGHGVFLHLGQDTDGKWQWVRWYRWRPVDNLAEGVPLPPPTEKQRRRRFASAEEAAEYFREVLTESEAK